MSRDTGYTPGGGASTTVALEEPTGRQKAWVAKLERLLGELEELEREGRRLRAARLDAPEAVLLRFVVQQARGAIELMRVAQERDRRLLIVRGVDGPKLDLGPATKNVISLVDRCK